LLLGLAQIVMRGVAFVLHRLVLLLLQLLGGGRQRLSQSSDTQKRQDEGSGGNLFHHRIITDMAGTLFLKDRILNDF
jgi:hypothetical protein